jgi:hypothetical protein
MDNEISKTMKNHICNKCKLTLELVPPGCHRCNAAEVAIHNFKSHLLSVLAGVANDFPPSLGDRLLPQTEITLNLLHQSNALPNILAYAHLSGPFDYNKMPLAPMGCEVQVHEKADKQGTWAYHSVGGWYLSTSPDEYRTHLCHIKNTSSNRLSDIVHFKHKHITNPTLMHANKIMRELSHCTQVLKGKDTTATDQESCNLQRLVEVTQANLLQQVSGNSPALPREQTQPPIMDQLTQQTQAAPRVQPNALPRVQPNEQNTKHRITQSTATQQSSTTDIHQPRITRWRGRRNNTLMLQETKKDSDHLRLRTRSQSAREAQQASPPALNTCSKLAANAVT